jgi:hypothetical protein
VQVLGLSDGSVLLLDATPAASELPKAADDGTLALPVEVTSWIGEAVAAGVTFEVLKTIVVRLPRNASKAKAAPATAASVAETVETYMRSSGYRSVLVGEIRQVSGQGWTLTGTADGATFRARADEQGRVIHVRIR